jgi:hypothetical protein
MKKLFFAVVMGLALTGCATTGPVGDPRALAQDVYRLSGGLEEARLALRYVGGFGLGSLGSDVGERCRRALGQNPSAMAARTSQRPALPRLTYWKAAPLMRCLPPIRRPSFPPCGAITPRLRANRSPPSASSFGPIWPRAPSRTEPPAPVKLTACHDRAIVTLFMGPS